MTKNTYIPYVFNIVTSKSKCIICSVCLQYTPWLFFSYIHFYIMHYLKACNCYLFIFNISNHAFINMIFSNVSHRKFQINYSLDLKQSEQTHFIYHLKHLKLTYTFNWDGFIFMQSVFFLFLCYISAFTITSNNS